MSVRALVVCLLLGCSRSTSIVTDVQPTPAEVSIAEAGPEPTPVEAEPIDGSTSVATKSSPEPSRWPTIEAKPPSLAGKAAESGRPRGDRSRALPGWDTGWVRLGPPKDAPDGEVRGKVREIRPAVGEVAGVVRIEGEGGAVVELELRGSGKLALAVGDEVMAKWQTVHIQIHTIDDLAVVDAKGRVVYAGSGTGNPGFAPGWYFERKGVFHRASPHMRGGAHREERWLVIGNGAAAAFVHSGEGARRLSTPDGDYAVAGSAVTWSAGMRPPDSSEYETFSIVRLP